MDSKTLDFTGRVLKRAETLLRNDGVEGASILVSAMNHALAQVLAESDPGPVDPPADKPKRKS